MRVATYFPADPFKLQRAIYINRDHWRLPMILTDYQWHPSGLFYFSSD
jgi:hypothetical protein